MCSPGQLPMGQLPARAPNYLFTEPAHHLEYSGRFYTLDAWGVQFLILGADTSCFPYRTKQKLSTHHDSLQCRNLERIRTAGTTIRRKTINSVRRQSCGLESLVFALFPYFGAKLHAVIARGSMIPVDPRVLWGTAIHLYNESQEFRFPRR